MIFHPLRLAVLAIVCLVLGIGGADAKSPGRAAPVDEPRALADCLETAAGLPAKVQDCVVRYEARRP
jgi:hypothetical protein